MVIVSTISCDEPSAVGTNPIRLLEISNMVSTAPVAQRPIFFLTSFLPINSAFLYNIARNHFFQPAIMADKGFNSLYLLLFQWHRYPPTPHFRAEQPQFHLKNS